MIPHGNATCGQDTAYDNSAKRVGVLRVPLIRSARRSTKKEATEGEPRTSEGVGAACVQI